ncbi:hypothetical protein BC826DRAFT_1107279 [Russula brevipes]|nr:hypothetical protein BC826DRAFT_1107279 [Russula brevipes]
MPHPSLPIPRLQPAENNGQCAPNYESQTRRLDITFIDILDDDSLLIIICFYRRAVLDEVKGDDNPMLRGGEWSLERWWYRLAQVCRRWRNLVFGSAAYLGLCLVCSYGTPVAEMLAHSPPLPLIMDYVDKKRDLTMGDEEAISIGFQHRDRIRCIRFYSDVSSKLQKWVAAIDDEFPMLEFLSIEPGFIDSKAPVLPQTFRAPHLRHLELTYVPLTIGFLLPTSLVRFWLEKIPSSASAYFSPRDLLTQLSLMPHLETLGINFQSTPPNDDEMLHSPIMVPITLRRLRFLKLGGTGTYLGALLPSMTTPLLEWVGFSIFSHDWPTFVAPPNLLQFIGTTMNVMFSSAKFMVFQRGIVLFVYSHDMTKKCALDVHVHCGHVATLSAMAQICNILGPLFSSVVDLTLTDKLFSSHFTEDTRGLFGAFNGVKTLHVASALVLSVSRSLQFDGGEPSSTPELLPELKELSYSSTIDASDSFAPFINARQDSGRPVTLIRR